MPPIYYIASNDWLNITFRLCFALLIGAIVGIERQLTHKPAGLRTHMLVSFGAALFSLIVLQSNVSQSVTGSEALSRVIQGIATGVGFIGAGEILRQSSHESNRMEIQGLTSAAAIWVSAALGIAAGSGLWQLGLIGAFLCLLVLSVFKRFERH
ncbi:MULTISPECIES: MgtC/SapB family protein [Nostocales]|uniref:MgtC/SapB family protein n=3 Tax=Nostocales TaxID=1161 RepID=A0A0C1ND43_9CYAN|nr:MgtC/SapB family protein [Tolypothrix bouteillei]KAF3888397.1 MgtC/SapB family protein [Tolypothrix bouteillei VB521301]